MEKSTVVGKLCLVLVLSVLVFGCATETRSVGPGNPRSDGGAGGTGGASGTGGTGGTSNAGSRGTCETCVHDIDCKDADHRCVEMEYRSLRFPNDETGFCLQVAIPLSEGSTSDYDCAPPYVTVLLDNPSVDGGDVDPYCGIREELTTCIAVRAHQDARECTQLGDDPCPDGGFCDWIKIESGGWKEFCTYACVAASECQGPGGELCSDRYCGW